MKKLSSSLLLISLVGAIVFIIVNGIDAREFLVPGIAALVGLPFSILFVKASSPSIKKVLLALAFTLSAFGTAWIAYVAAWGLRRDPETFAEEKWVFIVTLTFFASVTLFLFTRLVSREVNSASSIK